MPSLATTVELQFGGRLGRPPQGVHFAPGRALLLGEHRPADGGHLLAAALPEGVACAWGMRPDSRVVVWGMNARQKDSFHQATVFRSGRGWSDLARGAYAHVARDRGRMPGLDLLVQGDLPMGEGLCASEAYLVVLLRCIHEALGAYRSRWELAEDLPAIEREWRRRRTAQVDAYVAAALRPGRVLHVDASALEHEVLALPEGGRVTTQPLGTTPASALAAPEEAQRATEAERVGRAAAALAAGDLEALGRLMDESHAARVEGAPPALRARVAAVRAQPGVLGARLQDGGRIVLLERPPGQAPA